MGFTSITANAFEKDIESVLRVGHQDPKALRYSIIIHTVDSDIIIDLLESIEVLRDYVNNITDFILVNFKMKLGDYVYDVLPYNDNMEITIKLHWYKKTTLFRYKFVLANITDTASSVYENIPKSELNEQELANVEGQCVDRLVEVMRTTVCDGVYNYANVGSVMKSVLVEKLNEVTIEGAPMKVGKDGYRVTIDKCDNDTTYRHIEIPFGVNIYNLPSYLQNTKYGLYKGGAGTYQQTVVNTLLTAEKLKPVTGFYTYPIYDSLKYTTSPGMKLMILSYPTGKYRNSEHTYTVDGDVIKIVASGNLKNLSVGANVILDKGNTFVKLDSKKVTGTLDTVTDDGVTNSHKDRISSVQDNPNADGVSNVKYVDGSDNLYKHMTDVTATEYTLFQTQWDFSNHELLYPGMPVGLLYTHKDLGIIRIDGTLSSTYTKYDKTQDMCSTMLNVMVANPTMYNDK